MQFCFEVLHSLDKIFKFYGFYYPFQLIFKMAKDSRILDWHAHLEDKCFIDQECQVVSIM